MQATKSEGVLRSTTAASDIAARARSPVFKGGSFALPALGKVWQPGVILRFSLVEDHAHLRWPFSPLGVSLSWLDPRIHNLAS